MVRPPPHRDYGAADAHHGAGQSHSKLLKLLVIVGIGIVGAFALGKAIISLDRKVGIPGMNADQLAAFRKDGTILPTSIRPNPQYPHTLSITSDSWSPWILLPQGHSWRFCDASRSVPCEGSEPTTYHYEAKSYSKSQPITKCSVDGCENIYQIRFRANGAPVTLRYRFTAHTRLSASTAPVASSPTPLRADRVTSSPAEKVVERREQVNARSPYAARDVQNPSSSRGSQARALQGAPPANGSVLCMLPSLEQVRTSERACRERGGSIDVESQ